MQAFAKPESTHFFGLLSARGAPCRWRDANQDRMKSWIDQRFSTTCLS
ncbi:hypothetical protein [Chitinophaga rupis]|nr:hypothetical protein [Chitinophaga rupis]